ncbi:hypothetical protein BU26DRAFT_498423 [Trematosphaeria pertusa]|uniref:Uncharacterized protein n=1 Tax=Trematosphaeria pertusa TaxID=390896 RepID=A0A6A6J2E2_9PLEO|nr:uncharacterized protein BU26DRAFT_498423 [Trematosphaeria pertusa]KAF2255623.1 hypothetical protein BU26DRAFT_498423 [Trematosphaeria pertusa]
MSGHQLCEHLQSAPPHPLDTRSPPAAILSILLHVSGTNTTYSNTALLPFSNFSQIISPSTLSSSKFIHVLICGRGPSIWGHAAAALGRLTLTTLISRPSFASFQMPVEDAKKVSAARLAVLDIAASKRPRAISAFTQPKHVRRRSARSAMANSSRYEISHVAAFRAENEAKKVLFRMQGRMFRGPELRREKVCIRFRDTTSIHESRLLYFIPFSRLPWRRGIITLDSCLLPPGFCGAPPSCEESSLA